MKRIAVKVIAIAALLGSMAAVNWSSIVRPAPQPIGANWNSGPANVNWSS